MNKKLIYGLLIFLVIIIVVAFIISNRYNCEFSRRQIQSSIDDMNCCEVPSDCKTYDLYTCPFGCSILINKDADPSKEDKRIDRYTSRCEKCVYDCPPPPNPEEMDCIENKCVDTRVFS